MNNGFGFVGSGTQAERDQRDQNRKREISDRDRAVTALIPFYLLFKQWTEPLIWTGASAALAVVLYFTWYRTLPPADEDFREAPEDLAASEHFPQLTPIAAVAANSSAG